MLRGILPILSVGVLVLGGSLLAYGDDRDDRDNKDKNGNKKQHQAILNAVSGGTNSSNTAHGQLSNGITALSGGHQAILDAVNGGEGNHTLRWDTVQPAATRFVVLTAFTGAAVLDNETGLVWEQSPDATPRDWSPTLVHCANRTTGGRMGWRLPSAPELASLMDPNNVDNVPPEFQTPALPPGHPFSNILLDDYWSSTTNADDPALAWDVNFAESDVRLDQPKEIQSPALGWCVRGGVNAGQH